LASVCHGVGKLGVVRGNVRTGTVFDEVLEIVDGAV
jgi:hypothetical protein